MCSTPRHERAHGVTMSIGRSSVTRIVKKYKINTKSSTEAELIGANNVMHKMLWTQYLMRCKVSPSTKASYYKKT